MISQAEIEDFATAFGVPDSQIVKDHLISHALAALGVLPPETLGSVTLFGGTALCRTWCPDLRLSEDIDVLIDAPNLADEITSHISRTLRREFPRLSWEQLGSQHRVETRNLHDTSSTVKIQFAQRHQEWKDIPTTQAPVLLRYGDVPDSVTMTVPTPSGFAAMKLMAWFDRRAPRDLFDLAALAIAGHVDRAAVDLVKCIAGYTPSSSMLGQRVPKTVESSWQSELGHQHQDVKSAGECLELLRTSLAQAAHGDPP